MRSVADLAGTGHRGRRNRGVLPANGGIGHNDPAGAAPDALTAHAVEADRWLTQHYPEVQQPRVLEQFFVPAQRVIGVASGEEDVEVELAGARYDYRDRG